MNCRYVWENHYILHSTKVMYMYFFLMLNRRKRASCGDLVPGPLTALALPVRLIHCVLPTAADAYGAAPVAVCPH